MLRLPATSAPFAKTDNLLLLARVAETWGARPSELLGVNAREHTLRLQIDIAAAAVLWRWRGEAGTELNGTEEWW